MSGLQICAPWAGGGCGSGDGMGGCCGGELRFGEDAETDGVVGGGILWGSFGESSCGGGAGEESCEAGAEGGVMVYGGSGGAVE